MKHRIFFQQLFQEPFIDCTYIGLQIITDSISRDQFLEKIKEIYLDSAETVDINLDKELLDQSQDTFFEIEYSQIINQDKSIIFGLTVKAPGDISDFNLIGIFFDTVLDEIKEKFEVIWRFHNDFLRDQYSRLFLEIYDMEILLRECISYIFACKYYPLKDHRLIGEHNVNHSLKSKIWGDVEKEMENIFYYLTFEDYTKLDGSALKDPTSQVMRDFLEKSHTFEDFQDLLLNRGIVDEVHRAFLLSIKELLIPIGLLRNGVMHGRNFSEDEYANYTLARGKLIGESLSFLELLRGKN